MPNTCLTWLCILVMFSFWSRAIAEEPRNFVVINRMPEKENEATTPEKTSQKNLEKPPVTIPASRPETASKTTPKAISETKLRITPVIISTTAFTSTPETTLGTTLETTSETTHKTTPVETPNTTSETTATTTTTTKPEMTRLKTPTTMFKVTPMATSGTTLDVKMPSFLDVVVSWKKHPPACYYIKFPVTTENNEGAEICKEKCSKDNSCKQAIYLPGHCSLSAFPDRLISSSCNRKSVVFEKVMKKKIQATTAPRKATTNESLTLVQTTAETTPETTPESTPAKISEKLSTIIDTRFIEYRGICPEISDRDYPSFNTTNASICERACGKIAQCVVAIYNVENFRCHVSSEFQEMRRCSNANIVFEKVDEKHELRYRANLLEVSGSGHILSQVYFAVPIACLVRLFFD